MLSRPITQLYTMDTCIYVRVCAAAKCTRIISLEFYCFLMIFSCFIRHHVFLVWLCPLTMLTDMVCLLLDGLQLACVNLRHCASIACIGGMSMTWV